MDTPSIPMEPIESYLGSCYRAFLRGDPPPDFSAEIQGALDPDARSRIDEVVERLREQAESERGRRGRRTRPRPVTDGLPRKWPDVPGYEITDPLGSGGFGRVYRAISHHHFGAPVALKIIRPRVSGAAGWDEPERRRLLAWMLVGEARILAHIGHANVVRYLGSGIIERGPEAGTPFIATELIDGPSLARRIGDSPQEPRWAARIMAQLADAVDFVHQLKLRQPVLGDDEGIDAGILHRDIKPANILLGREDQPYLTDFGLAGRVRRASSDEVILAGTPGYAAPEQLREDAVLTPAVDVYGLGATLHHLLTGKPPQEQARTRAQKGGPAGMGLSPPRLLSGRIPVDLERICQKCLEPEPARRYQTAGAVRDDLRRFLEGKPVSVNPVGPWGRSIRWARHSPRVATLAASLVIALVLGLGVTTFLWRIADADRQLAEAEFEVASQTLDWFPALSSEGTHFRRQILAGPSLIPHLRRARGTLLALLRRRPHHLKTHDRLAKVDFGLASILIETGRHGEARTLLEEAMANLKQALDAVHPEPSRLWDQWVVLDLQAHLDGLEHKPDEAFEHLKGSVVIGELLLQPETDRDWKLSAHLADQRIDLACILVQRSEEGRARSLLEANVRMLEQTPRAASHPRLAIRRILTHESLRGIAPVESVRPAVEPVSDCSEPLSRLISVDADSMSADVWAQLFTQIISPSTRPSETAADDETVWIYESTQSLASRASERRRSGRLDEAGRVADRMHAVALRLQSLHPEWAIVHLAMSEAYLQLSKNARRTGDREAIERNLRLARDSANQALILEPDNYIARRDAADRQRRLEVLLAEGKPTDVRDPSTRHPTRN